MSEVPKIDNRVYFPGADVRAGVFIRGNVEVEGDLHYHRSGKRAPRTPDSMEVMTEEDVDTQPGPEITTGILVAGDTYGDRYYHGPNEYEGEGGMEDDTTLEDMPQTAEQAQQKAELDRQRAVKEAEERDRAIAEALKAAHGSYSATSDMPPIKPPVDLKARADQEIERMSTRHESGIDLHGAAAKAFAKIAKRRQRRF